MTYNPARWARFWRRFLVVQGALTLAAVALVSWTATDGHWWYVAFASLMLAVNCLTLRLAIKWLRISIRDQKRYGQ